MKKTLKKTLKKTPPLPLQVETQSLPAVPELKLDAPLATESIQTSPVVDEVMLRAKRKWIAGLVLFVLFIVLMLFMGVDYKNTISTTVVPTSIPLIPTSTPRPTPIISLRISIWNGSGIAGFAGTVGTALKADGYEVKEITNAPQAQTGTTLYLASTVKEKESELKKALLKNKIEVTNVEVLTSDEFEVRIVLGR